MNRFASLLPLVGFAALLALWGALTSSSFGATPIVESFSPWKAFPAFAELVSQPRTWEHSLASLRRIGVGLSIAFTLGFPLGLLMGSFARFNKAVSASTQYVRMISPLAWMPIAIMILGIGDKPIFFLITIATMWSIALNTAIGVQSRDRRLVEMSASLGASSWEILRHVTIPSIRGSVLTGLRVSLGVAWLVLVPAEMLGVRSGLGYAILDARDRMAYPEIMAIILLIGCFGWALDTSLRVAEQYGSTERRPRRAKKNQETVCQTPLRRAEQSDVLTAP